MSSIFVYLFVPVVLKYTIWRNVFRFMSVFGILITLVWMFKTRGINMGKAKPVEKVKENKSISIMGLIALSGLVPIFIVIALHGILRDGILTWLPSLVNKQFNLGESSSVLSAAILPLFSMVSVIIANTLNNKIKHEIKTAAIMFGFSFAATLPIVMGIKIPIITIVCAALISASMHGVNHMLISLIPKNFAKYGMVSTFSGVLNAFTYIGASVSSYGFATISDNFGWDLDLGAIALLWQAGCIIRADFLSDIHDACKASHDNLILAEKIF